MIRLGFAVRAVGRPGLSGASTHRNQPHLSVLLTRLGDMLAYLTQIDVRYYRAWLPLSAADGLAQINDCMAQIDLLAAQLAAAGVRISLHAPHGLSLASPDTLLVAETTAIVEASAVLLAALDARRPAGRIEGVLVMHLGASATDPEVPARFVSSYRRLSPLAQAHLALEHEANGPGLGFLLKLHQHCGVALVFDALHWALHNPEALPLDLALGLALATWPATTRPEVHLSSQRSEAHLLPGRAGDPARIVPPRPGQHADFVAVGDLDRLLRAAHGLPPFDLMLEAKAGELAIARLRSEILRCAPMLAISLS